MCDHIKVIHCPILIQYLIGIKKIFTIIEPLIHNKILMEYKCHFTKTVGFLYDTQVMMW